MENNQLVYNQQKLYENYLTDPMLKMLNNQLVKIYTSFLPIKITISIETNDVQYIYSDVVEKYIENLKSQITDLTKKYYEQTTNF